MNSRKENCELLIVWLKKNGLYHNNRYDHRGFGGHERMEFLQAEVLNENESVNEQGCSTTTVAE